MKKYKNRSELVKQLLLQNPGMSEKDIAQEFHKSDKGSVPYWAKFILVFLIRLAAVSGFVMPPDVPDWLDSALIAPPEVAKDYMRRKMEESSKEAEDVMPVYRKSIPVS